MINRKISIALLYLLLLFVNMFMTFQPIENLVYASGKIFFPLVFIIGILSWRKIYSKCTQNKVIFFFCILIILSIITSYVFENQSPIDSLLALYSFIAIIPFYYILKVSRIKEREIVKVLTVLSFIYIAINMFQQVLPIYLFGSRSGEEIRFGLNRYSIWGDRLCIIPLFYYLSLWMKSLKRKYLLVVLFMFVGIFFQLERILLASVSIAILLMLFLGKKEKKTMKYYLILFFLISVPFFFFSSNESKIGTEKMIERTNKEIDEGDNNLRYLSISYYLTEFNNTTPKFLFGTGVPYKDSSYGKKIESIEDYGFFRADIGIFGDISTYGLISVIILAIILIRLIFFNNDTPTYIKYILLFFVFGWILNSSIDTAYRLVLWPIILYLIDIHKNAKKEDKFKKVIAVKYAGNK